jgi:DNA-binding transcriptional LysR family regulator
MRQDKPGHWHLYREESRISIRTSGRFQMNSIGMMRRFASMGAGIAILPTTKLSGKTLRIIN